MTHFVIHPFVNFVAVLLFSLTHTSFLFIAFFSVIVVVVVTLQQGSTRVSMAQFVFPDDDSPVGHLLPVSAYC